MLEKIVSAVQTNRYLNAIKSAINKAAYINIALAVFIFVFYQFDQYGTVSEELRIFFASVYQYYCLLLALIFAYVISSELTEEGVTDHFRYATVFLVALFAPNYIPNGYGTVYPFVACILAVFFHALLEGLNQFKAKSKRLPQAVVDYWNRIFPLVIVFSVAFVMTYVLRDWMYVIPHAFMFVTDLLNTPVAVIATILLICSFWVLGIHGVGVIGTLLRPFWLFMMVVNGFQVIIKQPAIYIGSETFFQWIVWLGGSGCTLGLSLAMRYFSKSQHMKELGKEAIVSNWFNINENIIFGVPIVDNKHFRLPFFLAPIACAALGYIAFYSGYVTIPSIVAPWVLPVPIGIFISTLGDIRAVGLSFLLILISFLVYFPFFKKYDLELFQQENNN